jgi:hypothetical protein
MTLESRLTPPASSSFVDRVWCSTELGQPADDYLDLFPARPGVTVCAMRRTTRSLAIKRNAAEPSQNETNALKAKGNTGELLTKQDQARTIRNVSNPVAKGTRKAASHSCLGSSRRRSGVASVKSIMLRSRNL